jgi:RNA polymerase sigma factor (sigma-70 family)
LQDTRGFLVRDADGPGLLIRPMTDTSGAGGSTMLHLLGQYAEGGVRLAYHLTRDREAALDISQEAYVRAMQSIGELQKNVSIKVWFNRIVVNLCRDWMRRRKVEARGLDVVQRRAAQEQPQPGDTIENKEEAERLRAALMQLPFDRREAVVLVCIEDFSPKEAAHMLGIPDGTLRARLHQGREQLRAIFSDDEKGRRP